MLSSRIRPLGHHQSQSKQSSTSQPGGGVSEGSSGLISQHNPFSEQKQEKEEEEEEEEEEDAESLLSSFLPHLFPDDTPLCLGDPGQALVYSSSQFGDMNVCVPDYGGAENEGGGGGDKEGEEKREKKGADAENVEAGRKLFAHYLWGGALVIADEIERRHCVKEGLIGAEEGSLGNVREEELWDVKGQDVLELGAGAALPSLIALRSGAKSVSITDHPSAKGICGPIQQSLAASVPSSLHQNVSIYPYTWGTFPNAYTESTGDGSNRSANEEKELSFATSGKSKYTRIICADCLWMPEQHDNLARSIAWFLKPPSSTMGFSKRRAAESRNDDDDGQGSSASPGAAYVVAGFHTGRDVVASFFQNAVPKAGLLIERIYERDLNAKVEDGRVTREWKPERPGENDRSRWCVVAFLRRRQSASSH